MNENPFSSPSSASTRERVKMKREPFQTSPIGACLLIAGFSVVGFLAGIVCDVCIGLLVEETILPYLYEPGAPRLSYGAMLLVMCPIAGMLGGGIGASFAARMLGWTLAARLIGGAAAFLSAMIVSMIWTDSIQSYGFDPSDIVLYVPILIGVVAVASWVVIAGRG